MQIEEHDLRLTIESLIKSRFCLSSFFLLFLISPFIISSIQLLHKWALVAMDMRNGFPILLDWGSVINGGMWRKLIIYPGQAATVLGSVT